MPIDDVLSFLRGVPIFQKGVGVPDGLIAAARSFPNDLPGRRCIPHHCADQTLMGARVDTSELTSEDRAETVRHAADRPS